MLVRAGVLVCILEIFGQFALGNQDADVEKEFASFVKKYKRTYTTKDKKRFETFKKNFNELKNLRNESYGADNFGVNNFMDWTKEEKQRLAGVKKLPKLRDLGNQAPPLPIREKRQTPTNFDWRSKNIVTPVKDQGQCGSCWAFAAVAVSESAYALKNGSFLDLSEQELVNCETDSFGCESGFPDDALNYIKNRGVDTNATYPYTGFQGKCSPKSGKTYITNWAYEGTDETQLTNTLTQKGPLVHMIWIPDSFYYLTSSSGVYRPTQAECQNAANNGWGHAITVVGYGTDNSTGYPYWLIKNSWGTTWGDKGYFKLLRGSNTCSMGDSMLSATVSNIITTNGTTNTNSTCFDNENSSSCSYWKTQGYCSSSNLYYQFMKSNCQNTCNFCTSG